MKHKVHVLPQSTGQGRELPYCLAPSAGSVKIYIKNMCLHKTNNQINEFWATLQILLNNKNLNFNFQLSRKTTVKKREFTSLISEINGSVFCIYLNDKGR